MLCVRECERDDSAGDEAGGKAAERDGAQDKHCSWRQRSVGPRPHARPAESVHDGCRRRPRVAVRLGDMTAAAGLESARSVRCVCVCVCTGHTASSRLCPRVACGGHFHTKHKHWLRPLLLSFLLRPARWASPPARPSTAFHSSGRTNLSLSCAV